MTAHGAFHWNELMTWNAKKAKDFYKKTLGWSFEDMPMGEGTTYTLIKSNGEMVGGMMQMQKGPMFDGMPEHWLAYIAVDDVDKRLKRIAIVADAAGAAQGWMVPAPQSM